MRQATLLSRRATLHVLGAVPVVSAVLAACGKPHPPDSCGDVSALSGPEQAARSALQYTDRSPNPDKKCSNCKQFKPPAQITECGACQVVKGPIHPEGYCSSWAAKA